MTGAVTNAFGETLAEDAPDVPIADALAILRQHYGLAGTAQPLPGERDHNFHIRTDGEGEFVLKISHPAEEAGFTDFQNKALDHILAVDPALPVPSVRKSLDRDAQFTVSIGGSQPRIVRLVTYLPGQLLSRSPVSAGQDRNLGIFLARLGRALRGFFHPAAGSDLLWDIRKVAKTRPMLAHIVDAGRRAMVERVIDAFEEHAAPIIPSLRAQIVHNDMNSYNVVMDASRPEIVSGILDFGDMIHSPLICDLAIGAVYRWPADGHPLAPAARFVAGYQSVQPLEAEEIGILFDLIRARLALIANIATWQAERFPAKRDYVLRLITEVWASLERLDGLSHSDARRYFLDHSNPE
ncbi:MULTISPECIES: phosphotransferase [unclassified Mesorhizobium]|uniref:phosphotransferase n=1 Tax=unclassified Mesorhizobium TaxID=325217 RepID=UPI001127D116|nr:MULTISPECIES: phosphotransferase [unclassified Mesorhizobium]TPK61911.1 serine kinase [Mesorhizobium sp. B2-5-1]TPM64887.1 serine kinase [Mesorhizobium sp. B2-1-9]TPM80371.1 serine kinase [Mesorhizobium sp. B2-1-4]TPN14528.1 serine kinase [Mesorhizobium sp. B2-1-2]UCI12594.1 phosphotransferase [Mesorhizobium sp. B2-1-1]